jgi:hypothetical protein
MAGYPNRPFFAASVAMSTAAFQRACPTRRAATNVSIELGRGSIPESGIELLRSLKGGEIP